MQYGFYTDKGLDKQPLDKSPWNEHNVNTFGYRCPEWDPMPDGKKNVVVLGCSHTFGQGLEDNEHWVYHLSQHNSDRLRVWNLGVPGASGDCCVRRLWGTQSLIAPKIIIICWPDISRRAWYPDNYKPATILGHQEENKFQTENTDLNNFLHNVWQVQKYVEIYNCKSFHCFATDTVKHKDIKGLNVLHDYTIKNCWPYWDKFTQRQVDAEPNYAKDKKHYGTKHHKRFAELFLEQFGQKLR